MRWALDFDAVKITVIATGFQPENAPLPDRRVLPDVLRVQPRPPEPAMAAPPMPPPHVPAPAPPVAAPVMERRQPEPEPAPVEDVEIMLDMEDVETPAYLRQGRLVN